MVQVCQSHMQWRAFGYGFRFAVFFSVAPMLPPKTVRAAAGKILWARNYSSATFLLHLCRTRKWCYMPYPLDMDLLCSFASGCIFCPLSCKIFCPLSCICAGHDSEWFRLERAKLLDVDFSSSFLLLLHLCLSKNQGRASECILLYPRERARSKLAGYLQPSGSGG